MSDAAPTPEKAADGHPKSPSKAEVHRSPGQDTPQKKPAAKAKDVAKVLKRPASSKAAAKPTPKPRSVMKSVLKRPASSNSANQTTQQKGGKLAPSTWATGLMKKTEEKTEETEEGKADEEGCEEETKTVDECVEPDKFDMDDGATLNRSKNNKFIKLLESGQLPQWLSDEYHKISKLKTGKRDKMRDLINQALDHKGGKLILSTDKPCFQTLRKTFEETKSQEIEKTLPKRLLMGKFNLSEEDFDLAVQEGDLVEVKNKKGRTQYMWDSSTHMNSQGKMQESGVGSEKQISKKQKESLEFAQQSWSIGLFVPTGDSSGSGGQSGGPQLAIKDKQKPLSSDQWLQAAGQLKPAIDAFEVQSQKGLKCLNNIGHNKEDALYAKLWLGLH